jgi:hypothetical protein
MVKLRMEMLEFVISEALVSSQRFDRYKSD